MLLWDMDKKYYFVTYQGRDKHDNNISCWNACIKVSPMQFIMNLNNTETSFCDLVLLSIHEITENEYKKYVDEF